VQVKTQVNKRKKLATVTHGTENKRILEVVRVTRVGDVGVAVLLILWFL
jgi:hypothetical protein